MNKASVLIDVVAIISEQLEVKRELLYSQLDNKADSKEVCLNAGGMQALLALRDRLQGQIEAEISAYETAQGM